ncbi:MAG: dienelactone hydrolase family protein [Candidatus Cyclobacteriaceae bacterium M3_2C_046]
MKKAFYFIIIFIHWHILPAQEFALDQLENSPRHHEWVTITTGEKNIHSFVAYPESSNKSLSVIVIHENRGLTDWVRSFADQLAEQGFIAIAPDLLSEFNPNIEKTSDFASSDEARDAIYQLDPDFVTNALMAVQDYAGNLPSATGKTVVVGFCWGGSQSFRFATNSDEIAAAMVFYGSAPDQMDQIEQIEAPVYGFYGEDDQRINAGIPETEKMMEQAGNVYQYEIYKGAGHAFMRRGDDPDDSDTNNSARDKAFDRLVNLLNDIENP